MPQCDEPPRRCGSERNEGCGVVDVTGVSRVGVRAGVISQPRAEPRTPRRVRTRTWWWCPSEGWGYAESGVLPERIASQEESYPLVSGFVIILPIMVKSISNLTPACYLL